MKSTYTIYKIGDPTKQEWVAFLKSGEQRPPWVEPIEVEYSKDFAKALKYMKSMLLEKRIKVPAFKFAEMGEKLSTQEISEEKKIRGTVFWENNEYVMVSAVGTGTGFGWASIDGCRVEDTTTFKGALLPLCRTAHYRAVDAGQRERGYTGQIVRFARRTLVMCEAVTFVAEEAEKSLTLF